MALLEEYISLEGKLEFFNGDANIICGNINSIFKNLEYLQQTNNFLFRGMSDAKYKLYNSSQREFLKRELFITKKYSRSEITYNEWIKELITEVKLWNSKSVEKYFESIGIQNNEDIAYLSFMQHCGFPTPLLDFTENPFVALFFAIENANFNHSDIGIENCFSLYYINKKNELHETFNVDTTSGRNSDVKTYEDFIFKNGIAIIDHNSILFKVKNSMNIINQEGCFIFNWHAVNPLEVAYIKLVEQLKNGSLKDWGIMVKEEKMTCLNFHKSLIPQLKFELNKRKGINAGFIYPEIKPSKNYIVDDSIRKLLQ